MRNVIVTGLKITLAVITFAFVYSSRGKNQQNTDLIKVDFSQIPQNKFGDEVRYGYDLMQNTAYYIGPEGKNGKYLGNKMNCTNCHQEAGTKAFSFNLMAAH